jgi:arsenical-resistance protein 2
VAATLPWHAAYPAPRTAEPRGIAREEVLAMLKAQLKDQNSSGLRDFLLVDLRRVDHEVRHIYYLPALQ